MNIKEAIFNRKKKKLLDEDIRYMILSLQYYINKKEYLYLVYNIKNNEFLFYHWNDFKTKNKDEKIIYTIKKWVKMENIDYTDTYNQILINLDKDKNEIKDFLKWEIKITDEEFEKLYEDLQISKEVTKNEWIPEWLLINLSLRNKTFDSFLDKILHLEYIMENHHKLYFRKMEIYLKELKYEDII